MNDPAFIENKMLLNLLWKDLGWKDLGNDNFDILIKHEKFIPILWCNTRIDGRLVDMCLIINLKSGELFLEFLNFPYSIPDYPLGINLKELIKEMYSGIPDDESPVLRCLPCYKKYVINKKSDIGEHIVENRKPK